MLTFVARRRQGMGVSRDSTPTALPHINTPDMSEPSELREPGFAWLPVVAIAAALVLLLLAVAGRYGYHRDELYFLAAGCRVAWGFVDQPPLTPALARLSEILFPDSLVGLRLWPPLMVGGLVVVTSLTAPAMWPEMRSYG